MKLENLSGAVPTVPAYAHLVRSKRIEYLWLLAVLVRQMDLNFTLQDHKGLLPAISSYLRLGEISSGDPDAVRTVAMRLRATYKQMRTRLRQYQFPTVLQGNLTMLTQRMGLAEAERRVLALAILLRTNHTLFMAASASHPSVNVVQQVAQVIGSPARSVASAIAPSGVLQRSQLASFTSSEALAGNVRLQRPSFRRLAIEPFASLETMFGGVVHSSPRSTMTTQAYEHLRPGPQAIAAVLREALERRRMGVNILLYGAAGTGKTELARLLGQAVEAQSFEVTSMELGGGALEPKVRLSCAATAQLLLMKLRAVLIFDEIDAVFTDGSDLFGKPATAEAAKCWVNELLESNPVPMVWIANRIVGMDPAFIRRFDLVIHVGTPTQASRLELLRKECGLLEEGQLRRLSSARQATPAVLVRAARVAARIGVDPKATGRLMEDVIDGVLRAQGHPLVREQCRHSLPGDYDPSLCNTKVDLTRLVEGFRVNPSGRICLYGPPGTGKTAFGKWVSERLDRPLLLKRISDLQSPWLGEMERNLAKAFEQAAREGMVLQIDEVDSYLHDRREAQHSWQVSQVNEFLTQLESFDGIFIASTNLIEGLDLAAMRRFDFKIRMNYLRQSQVQTLLHAIAKRMQLSYQEDGSAKSKTSGLNRLTPGDFAVLERQHRTRPFESLDQLIEALCAEQSLKETQHQRIGFL